MPITMNPSVMDMSGVGIRRGNWRVKMFPEAASADFDYGECVILSTESVAPSDSAPSAGAFSSALADNVRILGVALKDATGTTGNYIPVAIPMDSTAELLIRVGSTTTGSDQELADVAVGDLATCIRYKQTTANGGRLRTCCGPAAGGSGTDKFIIREKYANLYSAGNVSEQASGDDFALVWVGFILDDTVMNRAVVP